MSPGPLAVLVPDLRPGAVRAEQLTDIPLVRPGFVDVTEQRAIALDGLVSHPAPGRLAVADAPAVGPFAARLAQALVEVMSATRPAPQVLRYVVPEVYAVLTRRSLLAARRRDSRSRPSLVRRVRLCQPAAGVAEVSVVFTSTGRTRAMALRLQARDRRWVVTALSVG